MLTNDTPITTPEDDRFGINPFAQALARAISEMPTPKGAVLAVNGQWGSGKSSAVNLILFHLTKLIEDEKLKVIRFSPWWLSGSDAITAAFFSELEAAIGRSVDNRLWLRSEGSPHGCCDLANSLKRQQMYTHPAPAKQSKALGVPWSRCFRMTKTS